MTERKDLGNRGELLAKRYLISSGYKIIATNYRYGHLEIDIIAKKNHEYVFVEVKTRINDSESRSEAPLTSWQSKNIKRAMIDYCYNNRINLEATRFDLIIILVSKSLDRATIKHYEDIF